MTWPIKCYNNFHRIANHICKVTTMWNKAVNKLKKQMKTTVRIQNMLNKQDILIIRKWPNTYILASSCYAARGLIYKHEYVMEQTGTYLEKYLYSFMKAYNTIHYEHQCCLVFSLPCYIIRIQYFPWRRFRNDLVARAIVKSINSASQRTQY